MPQNAISNRGQLLVIFVFAIIGLVAITGLAIDGGNIYADRRQAQNAADTAALAAALARNQTIAADASHARCDDFSTTSNPWPACAAPFIKAALDIADRNGYDNNPANNNAVEIHSPPADGYYSTCSSDGCSPKDYVEVIIRHDVNTWFARVLGISQLHNTVEAVALSRYIPSSSYFGGNSLVELKPTGNSCGGEFLLGGNGTVTIDGGGIFVNSDNASCAFKQVSCSASLVLTGGATFEGMGVSKTSCSPAPPAMAKATAPLAFPPDPPLLSQAPAECGKAPAAAVKSGKITTYHPGYYHSLPTGSNVKLAAGVYCVDDIKTTNSDHIDGMDGVFIYIKPDGDFSFDGGTIQIVAPSSGAYAGYLIYADSTFGNSHPNCIINGSASDIFTGMIYAPNCDVTIAGGSSPTGITAQIIAYTLTIDGSANLNVNFDPGLLPRVPEVNKLGLYH